MLLWLNDVPGYVRSSCPDLAILPLLVHRLDFVWSLAHLHAFVLSFKYSRSFISDLFLILYRVANETS